MDSDQIHTALTGLDAAIYFCANAQFVWGLTKSIKKRTTAVRNEVSIGVTTCEQTYRVRTHTLAPHPNQLGIGGSPGAREECIEAGEDPSVRVNPVTMMIIDPRVAAVRALVKRWPMEAVSATRSKYWRRGLE